MKILGQHDERTIQQLERCVAAEEGAVGVLCADGHLGYSMPIGGVVAYKDFISPSGVGYDIACGNMAVRTNIKMVDISAGYRERLADKIQRRVSFGVGRVNNEPIDHPVLDEIGLSPVPWQRAMQKMAADQLGTVGSGNHYVDVLEDENGDAWIANHFGSRGLGHRTAKGFMNIAQGRAWDDGAGEGEMDAPPLLLKADSTAGQDYATAMEIAGRYAYAGREAVIAKVLEILGARSIETIHNHHNFAWRELVNGRFCWVVRKGATPAFPGQLGFVGGSMGDISVILQGVASAESAQLLYSTVHGAGRVMSRTQAAGKQRWVKGIWRCGMRNCDGQMPLRDAQRGKNGELPRCSKCGAKMHQTRGRQQERSGGSVDFEAEKTKLVEQGVVLRGAGADEAPPVYRRLQDVLDAHAGTIEVLHTLQPRIVVMAGGDVEDPYKD